MCHRDDAENDQTNKENQSKSAKNKGSLNGCVPSNFVISFDDKCFKFFIYTRVIMLNFEVGRDVALLSSLRPIDADEIGRGVGWYFPSFVKGFYVFIERRVGDVPGELPHVGHTEELLGSQLVHEDVRITECLHVTPRS